MFLSPKVKAGISLTMECMTYKETGYTNDAKVIIDIHEVQLSCKLNCSVSISLLAFLLLEKTLVRRLTDVLDNQQ